MSMSADVDRPTTKALRLQAVAGLQRRIATRKAGHDPTGAYLDRREAEEMEREAEALLTLPMAPEIGIGGEIVPGPGSVQLSPNEQATRGAYLRDVAKDSPDATIAFASYKRLSLAADAGAAELAAEAAETIKAANALERNLAHQLGVAHKVAMETMARATRHNSDAGRIGYANWQVHAVEASRAMNAAARLMDAYQRGMLTLQRMRQGGEQRVVVVHQHVQVKDGGQAVVAGSMTTNRKRKAK